MAHLERNAVFLVLALFAVVSTSGARQLSSDDTAAQPTQSQAKAAPTSEQASASDPQPASSSKPLTTIVVNVGPSADILRSARNAGFKIKIADGTTHFCKAEAPIGTRLVSEHCINEGQLSIWLHRAEEQRDEIQHMLGAPSFAR